VWHAKGLAAAESDVGYTGGDDAAGELERLTAV
jgi:hypothetical protein